MRISIRYTKGRLILAVLNKGRSGTKDARALLPCLFDAAIVDDDVNFTFLLIASFDFIHGWGKNYQMVEAALPYR